MAQLIQIRQRIRTIETIKKITHAMRLISMSSHSRLRVHHEIIKQYVHKIASLFIFVKNNTNKKIPSARVTRLNSLVVVIGAQKSLCGNFNTRIIPTLTTFLDGIRTTPPHLIIVGKQMVDWVNTHLPHRVIVSYDKLTEQTYTAIAQNIAQYIHISLQKYADVKIIANKPVSFFNQKPTIYHLFPHDVVATSIKDKRTIEYTWTQSPESILDSLLPIYLQAHIEQYLFESLMAEQSARFLSMDTATRNAEQLLESTRIAYNKLRQAKITQEIVELSSSF